MSSMQYTTAQLEAIGAHGAVSVRAGAGSGKTGVLTARYLRALGEGLQPGDIVAVTFTEKAAAEMRARIRRGIDERGMSPSARARLQEALPDAPINTIHGLCASILREFPIEAGVDPAFEIADESHAWALKREAIDATITAAAGDPRHPARPHLDTLLSYYTRGEVAALVDEVSAVRRYFGAEAAALMELSPAELLAAWRRRIHEAATARLHALAGAARVQRVLDLFGTALPLCSDPEDKLLAVVRTALDAFQAISSEGAPEPTQVIAALAEAFLTQESEPRSFSRTGAAKNWRGGDISTVRDAAGQLAEELLPVAPLRVCAPHERDECTARLVHAAWRLADAVDRSYSDLKGRG
ncbi:MAG TPA: UvrD-helicase domain-containing protein, partial [Thermoleophilia bacterium]|nr:UvrD-helicase domain-containing protein [Thermoleophilia bacterium]